MHVVDDVDLVARRHRGIAHRLDDLAHIVDAGVRRSVHLDHVDMAPLGDRAARLAHAARVDRRPALPVRADAVQRSEEHTSELQSLMRISYAVFCLKKKIHNDYKQKNKMKHKKKEQQTKKQNIYKQK